MNAAHGEPNVKQNTKKPVIEISVIIINYW